MKFTITIDYDGKSFDVWSQKKENLTKEETRLLNSLKQKANQAASEMIESKIQEKTNEQKTIGHGQMEKTVF